MNSKRYFQLLFIFLLLTVSVQQLNAAGPSVRITSDARGNKVEVGETFHITIEAVNCQGSLNVTELPPGVKKVYHTTNQMESTTMVNGRTDHTITTRLILTCKGETPGSYKYGPVVVNGVKSNVLAYTVVKGSGNSSSGYSEANQNSQTGTSPSRQAGYNPNSGPLFVGKGNEEMFLRASVNKTSAYEQEAIEYTVKLYTSYDDIKFLGAAAAPKFEGFVVEESDDISKSLKFEQYNGKSYATAIIARYIIFPQKSGKLKVLGNTYTVSTDAKQYYHDPYFQTMTVRYPIQLNVTPNDIVIDVKQLPQPVPTNFMGGVGTFSVSSSLSSKALITNSAASLELKVEGTGNIKYLKLPEISNLFPASIEVFTPEVSSEVKIGSSNVSGYSLFNYSIMPHEAGDFEIPAVSLSYFDPSDGQYKTLKTEAYKVYVARGTASARSQQALNFNNELMPVGKPELNLGRPYVNSLLYWLWYIIPVVIFIIALGSYRKYMKDHEDIVLLRSKKANKMALKRLAKAYRCIKSKQEEEFYDEMLAALWGYIGDKLKMPVSELNRNNVGEAFRLHGVKETTFMPILKLIDECEYAKYTPVSRDANMHQLYTDALESLSKVEDEFSDKVKDHVDEDSDDNNQSFQQSSTNYVNSMISEYSNPSKQEDTSTTLHSSVTSDTTDTTVSSPHNTGKKLLIILGLISSSLIAHGGEAMKADSAYYAKNYEEAAVLYSQIMENEGVSAGLLYNLGNTYYHLGKDGEAMVCYQRAKKLDPSNHKINDNLEFLTMKVTEANKGSLQGKTGNVEPESESFISGIYRLIAIEHSSNGWSIFAVMAFILFLGAMGLYMFTPNVLARKTGFFSGITFLGFTIIFLIFAHLGARHFNRQDEAVLLDFTTELLDQPVVGAKATSTPLHKGTKLQILETKPGSDGTEWLKVRLNSENVGWVKKEGIEII